MGREQSGRARDASASSAPRSARDKPPGVPYLSHQGVKLTVFSSRSPGEAPLIRAVATAAGKGSPGVWGGGRQHPGARRVPRSAPRGLLEPRWRPGTPRPGKRGGKRFIRCCCRGTQQVLLPVRGLQR